MSCREQHDAYSRYGTLIFGKAEGGTGSRRSSGVRSASPTKVRTAPANAVYWLQHTSRGEKTPPATTPHLLKE